MVRITVLLLCAVAAHGFRLPASPLKNMKASMDSAVVAAVASTILTLSPAPVHATPTTFSIAATQTIEERKAERKAAEAAEKVALENKRAENAAKAAEAKAKAAEEEAPSVMNYRGKSASSDEEFNTKLLIVASLVVLISPIMGIQTARNAISSFKNDDIDLEARDNTRNF